MRLSPSVVPVRPARWVHHVAALSVLGAAWLHGPAHASEHTYAFTGLATVGARDGGPPAHLFTGLVTYQDDLPGSTEYLDSTAQGFRTSYSGAVSFLGIVLDNGERVEAHSGWLQVNNIQQAEIGSPVPAGLSMQVWTGGASGSINGLSVFNLYLAFLPVQPNFSWDGLDALFGGNAEQLLGANPGQLPATVDPLLTGTAIPEVLPDTFVNGLFLGTNHELTNTVNPVYTFKEVTAAVPEPATWALLLAGAVFMGWRVRAGARAA